MGALFWWQSRDVWISRRAWKALRAYRGFGLEGVGDDLKGTVKDVPVMVLPHEATIAAKMKCEPSLGLSSFGESAKEEDSEEEVPDDEASDKDGMVRVRFGCEVLDGFFTCTNATPEIRDRLLTSHAAVNELRRVVLACNDDVVGLELFEGVFKLTLATVTNKAIHTYLHPDQIDLWLPRLVALVQRFDEIQDFGPKRSQDEGDWCWDW